MDVLSKLLSNPRFSHSARQYPIPRAKTSQIRIHQNIETRRHGKSKMPLINLDRLLYTYSSLNIVSGRLVSRSDRSDPALVLRLLPCQAHRAGFVYIVARSHLVRRSSDLLSNESICPPSQPASHDQLRDTSDLSILFYRDSHLLYLSKYYLI